MPEGSYDVEALGDVELVIVLAWELPFDAPDNGYD